MHSTELSLLFCNHVGIPVMWVISRVPYDNITVLWLVMFMRCYLVGNYASHFPLMVVMLMINVIALKWPFMASQSMRLHCGHGSPISTRSFIMRWRGIRARVLASVNTLWPRQNGRHFADDIFKWIFLNENGWISIEISLKCVPKGPINNIPTLVQLMAWRRPGDKPLSEPMMVSYRRIYASLGLNE